MRLDREQSQIGYYLSEKTRFPSSVRAQYVLSYQLIQAPGYMVGSERLLLNIMHIVQCTQIWHSCAIVHLSTV